MPRLLPHEEGSGWAYRKSIAVRKKKTRFILITNIILLRIEYGFTALSRAAFFE